MADPVAMSVTSASESPSAFPSANPISRVDETEYLRIKRAPTPSSGECDMLTTQRCDERRHWGVGHARLLSRRPKGVRRLQAHIAGWAGWRTDR